MCLLALLAGVGRLRRGAAPHFRLNMQGRDPNDFQITGGESKQDRESKEAKIKGGRTSSMPCTRCSARPTNLTFSKSRAWTSSKIRLAAGRTGGNQDGTQRGLYRQHCVHCHGISGDGGRPDRGVSDPLSARLPPAASSSSSPRSAATGPATADLAKVLREGIPGTAMPSLPCCRPTRSTPWSNTCGT